MATTQIYLQGGPCDGRTVSADQIVGGLVAYIKCGGGYYEDKGAGARANGDPIWGYAGTSPPQPPGGHTVKAPHAHSGWHDLRRSVNHRWPHAMRESDKRIRAALRSLSRARKVRL